jgi:hypothetical protein
MDRWRLSTPYREARVVLERFLQVFGTGEAACDIHHENLAWHSDARRQMHAARVTPQNVHLLGVLGCMSHDVSFGFVSLFTFYSYGTRDGHLNFYVRMYDRFGRLSSFPIG